MLLVVVVTAWTARHFGPELFGLFNFSQALVWLFGLIAVLGLESIVVRDIVRRPENRARILASAFTLRFIAASCAAGLAVLSALILRSDDSDAWLLVAVLSLSLLPQAADVIDYAYQANVNSKPVVLLRNVSLVAASLLRIGVLVAGGGLIALAVTFVLEPVLFGALIYFRSRRDGLMFGWRDISLDECRRLIGQSWPLIISSASIAIYMRIDQVMLAQLGGDRAVGILSAAVKLSEAWFPVPISLMVSMAPGLIAKYQVSVLEYEREVLRAARILVRLAIIAAAGLALASPLIISLVYGREFSGAASVLAVHAWSGVFVCLGLISSNWLVTTGKVHYIMWQTGLGAAANIALNVLLIPRYGAIGTAVATVVGQSIATFLCHGLLKDTRPVFVLQLRALGVPAWGSHRGA